jgi:hypothetical protein
MMATQSLPPLEEACRLAEAREAMARTRQLEPRGGQLKEGIFATAGVGDWGDARPYARSLAFACRLCHGGDSMDAFRRLVSHIEARAGRILHERCPDGQPNYILTLQQLSKWHPSWRREPEDWRPRSGPAARQFSELLRHVLGPEEADRFTGSVFHLEPTARIRLLFGHLGRGENSRVETPRNLYLTKRMAYHLLQAPPHYDFIRALRWGQVFGLSGAARLARAIDFTRLAWQLWEPLDEEWWVGALHWFANHPELDPTHVTPIVDFAYTQRYGDPEIEHPPSPEFSLKGRSPQPLLRLIEEWHADVSNRRNIPHTEFRRTFGVNSGRWEIEAPGGTQIWTVDEILDSTTLLEEGRKMRHCVGTYLASIQKGKCSVWSMKVRRGDMLRRATTIQLDLGSRRIVQCRGHCNRHAKSDERKILKLWAKENGLTLSL